jgi:hypothetical protein
VALTVTVLSDIKFGIRGRLRILEFVAAATELYPVAEFVIRGVAILELLLGRGCGYGSLIELSQSLVQLQDLLSLVW